MRFYNNWTRIIALPGVGLLRPGEEKPVPNGMDKHRVIAGFIRARRLVVLDAPSTLSRDDTPPAPVFDERQTLRERLRDQRGISMRDSYSWSLDRIHRELDGADG